MGTGRTDQVPEFTRKARDRYTHANLFELKLVQSGKPTKIGFAAEINRNLRGDYDAQWFGSALKPNLGISYWI